MSDPGGRILLDTSALVHFLRDDAVARRMDEELQIRARSERPLISIITHGELLAFAKERGWGVKRVARIEDLIAELVVVDITPRSVLEAYAEVDAFCMKSGKKLGQNDLWIAATAIAATATLVTNDKDFDVLQGSFLSRVYYEPNPQA